VDQIYIVQLDFLVNELEKNINYYYNKYLKYKKKYLELQQKAGAVDENLNYFLNFNSISDDKTILNYNKLLKEK
jgi:hypothetical protein